MHPIEKKPAAEVVMTTQRLQPTIHWRFGTPPQAAAVITA
jgi:hypothetical protein